MFETYFGREHCRIDAIAGVVVALYRLGWPVKNVQLEYDEGAQVEAAICN